MIDETSGQEGIRPIGPPDDNTYRTDRWLISTPSSRTRRTTASSLPCVHRSSIVSMDVGVGVWVGPSTDPIGRGRSIDGL